MYRAIFASEAGFSDGDALRAAFGCQDIDLRPGSTVSLIGEISSTGPSCSRGIVDLRVLSRSSAAAY